VRVRATSLGRLPFCLCRRRADAASLPDAAPLVQQIPLTPMQTGLVVESLRRPNQDPFWRTAVYRLPRGTGQAEVLRAWQQVMNAHPALRTRLAVSRAGVTQSILPAGTEAELGYLERMVLDGSPGPQSWQEEHLGRLRQQRLAVTIGLLYVRELEHDGQTSPATVLFLHHVAYDGFSLAAVVNDFWGALLEGGEPQARPSVSCYMEWLQISEARQDAVSFWSANLRGLTPAADLSLARAAPWVTGPHTGARTMTVPEHATRKFTTFCTNRGLTTSAVITYVWSRLLAQYQQADEVCVGLTVAVRPVDLEEADRASGCLINVVPLRVDAAADSLKAVRSLMTNIADVVEHAHLPHSEMARLAGLAPFTRMFSSVLVFQNFDGVYRFPERQVYKDGFITDPLALSVSIGPEIKLQLEWDCALYDDVAVASLHDAVRHWIEHPCDLGPVRDVEGWASPAQLEATTLGVPATRIPFNLNELLLSSGLPGALAVVDAERELTYEQLRTEVRAFSQHLCHGLGLPPGARVALVGRRNVRGVVALLGSWYAHTSWCAIDADWPKGRRAAVIEALRPAAVIDLDDPAPWPDVTLAVDEQDDILGGVPLPASSPAYHVATSGSTGQPKLVSLAAGGLPALLSAWDLTYRTHGQPENVLQLGSWSSDVFVGDLLKALGSGGLMVICADAQRVDMAHLEELMSRHDVTLLESTPTLVASLFRHLRGRSVPPALRTAVVGSDTFRTSELQALVAARPDGIRLFNGYGLSECTVESLVLECDSGAAAAASSLAPFGRPLSGIRATVVDERGRLLPPFAVGALRLTGAPVGLGYLADGELVSGGTFQDSVQGSNARASFTTGDLVHVDAGGVVHSHGRRDRQVKVAGHRVELGDVENSMLSCRGVTEAAACTIYAGRTNRLIAFYCGDVAVDSLRTMLKARLPAPAVPTLVQRVDPLPRNTNGKVDTPALLQFAHLFTLPTTEPARLSAIVDADDVGLLEEIRALWSELLAKPVAVDRTFFDEGGTSLLVIVLHERLHELLPEADFGVADLFHHPTVSSFVGFLRGPATDSGSSRAQEARAGGSPDQTQSPDSSRRRLLEDVARGRLQPAEAWALLQGLS